MNSLQSNTLKLVASIVSGADTLLVYTDLDGVKSIRHVKVLAIKRCKNNQTVVECFDQQRDAVRKFRLSNIESVNPLAVVVVG